MDILNATAAAYGMKTNLKKAEVVKVSRRQVGK
jgi:hypothetical protein